MSGDLEARLAATVRASPRLMQVLAIARDLALPDWRIVSGAVYQTVWNSVTGRDPDYGLRDYDLFYFDGSDISYEAEDVDIRRAAAAYPADLAPLVEVRNQARVHLWYEEKFGKPYPPLARATDGIDRFLMHNAQVGIRASDGGTEVYAPRGFDDIFNLTVRPNRSANFLPDKYMEKAQRWKDIWPELTILPA